MAASPFNCELLFLDLGIFLTRRGGRWKLAKMATCCSRG